MRKIVIAGGTGFLGTALNEHFQKMGDEVWVLTRNPLPNTNQIEWDGVNPSHWVSSLDNADILINLSGKSVDCRYTEANKQKILSSRINSTQVLETAISLVNNPPKLWINASTATIYEGSLDHPMTEENGIIGDDFSMTIAKKWEKEFFSKSSAPRKVALRTSLVIGPNGGVIPVLAQQTKMGLGGYHGDGQQKFSWLHVKDFSGIVEFIISNKSIMGSINCTSPNPNTDSGFMHIMRKESGMNWGINSPKWLLEIGCFFLRTETELILKSRYVIPERLNNLGYEFQFPHLEEALHDIFQNRKN